MSKDSESKITEMTMDFTTTTEDFRESLTRHVPKDVGVSGAVSRHYTIRLKRPGYNDYELGNIETGDDARMFAEALAEVIPRSVVTVLEHKFIQSTVGVYRLKPEES